MTIRRKNDDTAARIPGRDGRPVRPAAKRPAPKATGTPKPPPNLKSNNRKSTSAPNIHDTGEKYTPKNSVSFERLFKNAAVTDSKYVKDVSITSLKAFPKATGIVGYVSRSITRDDKGPPRKYEHFLIARDGKQVSKSKAIKISCQCPRFMYYYEYALAQKGAADIIYSNGEFPSTTNPGLVPSMCKHGLALMYTVLKKERG